MRVIGCKPLSLVVALAGALLWTAPASASQLIDFNATDIRLAVNGAGQALVTYNVGRVHRHVLAWGAVNALPSSRTEQQVKFQLNYSATSLPGGNQCRPYDGVRLNWLVVACKAPDGSYWAVQRWHKLLPDYGLKAHGHAAASELHLSHWTGRPARLQVWLDWAYGRYHHLFGQLTYNGQGVYGFQASPGGSPLDSYGRNIYLDTFDSTLGKGWQRENSFLTHGPSGTFCYGFYPHGTHPAGVGIKYRATVIGPGVTPDVMWSAHDQGPLNPTLEREQNQLERHLGDPMCTR